MENTKLLRSTILSGDIILPENPDEVATTAGRILVELELHRENAEKYFSVVRAREGELLSKIQALKIPGLLEQVCEQSGIAIRTAYNYINYYKHRDIFQAMEISSKKAYALAAVLDDPEVTFANGKLLFGDGIEMSAKDIGAMDQKQVSALVTSYRRLKKSNDKTKKELAEISDAHGREIEKVRGRADSLARLVEAGKLNLVSGAMDALESHLGFAESILDRLLEMTLDEAAEEKIRVVFPLLNSKWMALSEKAGALLE